MFTIKHNLQQSEEPPSGGGGAEPITSEPITSEQPEASPSVLGDGLSFNEGWTEQLTGDYEGYRDMAGQFKNLPDLLKSYHDTRAKLSQRVQAPGEESTDEEKAAWRKSIGAPDSKDDYSLKLPDKMPEGVELSEEQLAPFKEFAFNNNLTESQVNNLIGYQIEMEGQLMQDIQHEYREHQESLQKELQNEWGADWSKKKLLAERAAETFGLGADHELMENPDVLRMLGRIAPMIGEDKLVSSSDITGTKSPGDMARDISNNPDNPYHEAYWDPSHRGYQDAQDRYQRLTKEQVAREQR